MARIILRVLKLELILLLVRLALGPSFAAAAPPDVDRARAAFDAGRDVLLTAWRHDEKATNPLDQLSGSVEQSVSSDKFLSNAPSPRRIPPVATPIAPPPLPPQNIVRAWSSPQKHGPSFAAAAPPDVVVDITRLFAAEVHTRLLRKYQVVLKMAPLQSEDQFIDAAIRKLTANWPSRNCADLPGSLRARTLGIFTEELFAPSSRCSIGEREWARAAVDAGRGVLTAWRHDEKATNPLDQLSVEQSVSSDKFLSDAVAFGSTPPSEKGFAKQSKLSFSIRVQKTARLRDFVIEQSQTRNRIVGEKRRDGRQNVQRVSNKCAKMTSGVGRSV